MMGDRTWLDFPDTDANIRKPTSSISAIRLVPPDDTNSALKWRLQPDNDPNRDFSELQQKRLSEYILDAAIGGPDTPSMFSSVHNVGRANSHWESNYHHIDTGHTAPRTGAYEPRLNPRMNDMIDNLVQEVSLSLPTRHGISGSINTKTGWVDAPLHRLSSVK
jgi:hypothetical protein